MMHYLSMIVISLISGILSGMWVWADKVSDIRLSINDVYMAALMTSIMIFLMSVLDKNYTWMATSCLFAALVIWMIRNQTFVSKTQYFQGMIPHHSMAVHMSKKLLEKGAVTATATAEEVAFVEQIIRTQIDEIGFMQARAAGSNALNGRVH